MARSYRLMREQALPRPRAGIFPFFADVQNLQEMTPPFLHFRILPPVPGRVAAGVRVHYRLRLFGIPFRWRTRIEEWDPPARFVDVQERGPFALWHHTHEFVDSPEGTLVRDTVEYRMPFGPLGGIVRAVLIGRTLERIFDYRRDVLARRFP